MASPDPAAVPAAVRAFEAARASGDVDGMIAAALALPTGQRFGVHPGRIPALVHEAYLLAPPPARGRLAAALARAWAYGNDPARARTFAAEAVELAGDDPALQADALDAALLTRWGPDDLAERLALTGRLSDATAHLAAPEPRLAAHLWALTTAWECLDIVAVQRQLRALDLLAEESGSARVAFFATSRRAMHALVTADLATADALIDETVRLGDLAAEPDRDAVVHSLAADRARRVHDVDTLCVEAAAFAAYGAQEGIASIEAQAAVLWLDGGRPDRAVDTVTRIVGPGVHAVPRDVDFLLVVSAVVEVATATGLDDLAAQGAALLQPYAGRAVLNAGAVGLQGVVDDFVHRAHRALGRPDADDWREAAARCYARIGAIRPVAPPGPVRAATVHLHPGPDGGWTVGRAGATATIAPVRGLQHLRHLLRHPGRDVAALDLVAGGVIDSSVGEVADRQALAAYRARLRELDEERAEAEDRADRTRLARLDLEREALLGELAAATGLAGRVRRFGSAQERARVTVRKAIAAALQRIETQDPGVARLLRDTVRTGATCRYEPDPDRPVTWVLDGPR
jgi:hypothetical protein